MKIFIKYFTVISLLYIIVHLTAEYISSKYFINRTFNGCLECHDEMNGFEEAHSPEKVGCDACHLGNPNTINKDLAHKEMILIPGNLSDAQKTCGVVGCHPGIPERNNNSIMNTMSGVISVNRFAFDELEKPEGHFNVKELTQSNADNHNRNLCASCHLGNVKTEWGPIDELSRGGGCNACHLNYSKEAFNGLNKYLNSLNKKENFPKVHPQLNLNVSNNHCFGCHSRSGRISTNYEGWFETLSNWEEVKNNKNYRELSDGRVFQKAEADVHYIAGMECIDCHLSLEIMGDGNLYQHMDEQLKVQCTDCHSKESKTISYEQLDLESKKIVDLRKSNRENEKFLITEKSNAPLINTYVTSSNEKYLVTKSTSKKLKLNPPKPICTENKAHQRLNCQSCHSKWVTHCAGCHTEFDPTLEGYDLLDNKDITGSWVEYPSDFYVDYPVLGIRKYKSGEEIVDTFIPGMILTIDKLKNPRKKIFKRLFAPTFSHTIIKGERSCISCHNNPLALGYGKGELTFSFSNGTKSRKTELAPDSQKTLMNGLINKINFVPHFERRKEDNLPKDAWIGFLKTRGETSTTRTYTRPFTVEEQKRILLVGACLNCHDEKSYVMQESLIDFESVLKRLSKKCFIDKRME